MLREMRRLVKLSIALLFVQDLFVVVVRRPFGTTCAEEIYDSEGELKSQDSQENGNGDDEIDSDNSDDILESNHEPFDPEKNGLLLHEYYSQVYEKFPEYDTFTMKQNLNYFGDVLQLDKEKEGGTTEQVNDGDRFVLDPVEKEIYLKVNETETEDTQDVEEEPLESETDADTDTDNEDANENNEQVDDWTIDV